MTEGIAHLMGGPLEEQSLDELWAREKLAMSNIDMLETDEYCLNHPRQPIALQEEKERLERIQAEIRKRNPPETVVGLKPGRLSGESRSIH